MTADISCQTLFMFISCKELEKGGMQAMLKASLG